MYQALYRKYRPQTLEEVGGQDTIVKILNNSISSNRINHAYLFTGPRGTGKTSIAKIFAKMVNCENLKNNIPCGKCTSCIQQNNSDIIEIDAASNNGVDEIRELRNKVNLVPAYGKYKVYIIDEVHMLTTGAFNALLKTLEEPPEHIIFILATTDPHKIPETILSRCQRLDFKKISENSIVKKLKEIAEKEKIDIEEEAFIEIARLSDGGLRDSIGMLDQVNSYTKGKIIVKDIHEINGTITTEDLKEIISLIKEQNIKEIFKKLDNYNDCGKNFVKLTEEIINFLRNILLIKEAPDYFKEINTKSEIYEDMAKKIDIDEIFKYIEILNNSLNEMKITNNPKLLLEIAIIKIINKKEESVEIISQEIPKKEEKPKEEHTEEIKEKTKTIDKDKLAQLKEIRINNTLSKFQKKEMIKIKKQLELLNNYLLNPDYSKYISMILDGELKAASDEYLIFVYKNGRLANLFNEHIKKIEETIKKTIDQKYKVIATDSKTWEIIKNEFNSKKKEYTYTKETIKMKEIFKENNKDDDFIEFKDIIEYK